MRSYMMGNPWRGDIVRVPYRALWRVDEATAANWLRKGDQAPEFVAEQEIVRLLPAQKVAFKLR